MKIKLIYLFLFFISINLASAVDFSGDVILNTSISNSSVTFSLNASIDYVEITPINIYILNATTSLRFCPEINHTLENSNLDSSEFCAGGNLGGSAYVPPIEEEFNATLRCSLSSIEQTGICLDNLGNTIWKGYPNAGILIFVLLIYVILLLMVINKDKILLVKNAKIYFKIVLWVLIVLAVLILFIWMFKDCKIQQLGEIKGCVTDFGNDIWPGHYYAGIFIMLFLLVIILLLFFSRRKSRKKTKP